MNKKLRLFTSIASLTLVIAVMSVAIWAAANATVTIGGTINYTATGNIRATVALQENGANSTSTPTITGGAAGNQPTATAGQLVFDGDEEAGLTGAFQLGTAGTITLTATDGQTENVTYSYTVTITNDYATADTATNKSLSVTFTLPTSTDYTTVTATGWDGDGATRTITLEPTESASVTVLFSVNPNISVTNYSIASSLALAVA